MPTSTPAPASPSAARTRGPDGSGAPAVVPEREPNGPMTWEDLCADPALRDLPYRIEQDRYGRLLMSPTAFRHGRRQTRIARLLEDALGGEAAVECAIETAEGVKVADVVWMSDAFLTQVDADAFALAVAPPICVEVMSPSNVWAEMEEKVTLYLARGAQEVWVCEPDGALRVFAHEGEVEASRLAPGAPRAVTV